MHARQQSAHWAPRACSSALPTRHAAAVQQQQQQSASLPHVAQPVGGSMHASNSTRASTGRQPRYSAAQRAQRPRASASHACTQQRQHPIAAVTWGACSCCPHQPPNQVCRPATPRRQSHQLLVVQRYSTRPDSQSVMWVEEKPQGKHTAHAAGLASSSQLLLLHTQSPHRTLAASQPASTHCCCRTPCRPAANGATPAAEPPPLPPPPCNVAAAAAACRAACAATASAATSPLTPVGSCLPRCRD